VRTQHDHGVASFAIELIVVTGMSQPGEAMSLACGEYPFRDVVGTGITDNRTT
jgi:hypothetical protein